MSRRGRLIRLGAALPIAILLLAVSATSVAAIDAILDVQVPTWHASSSGEYVGVQTAGQWAPPGTRSCVRYYSTWDDVARIDTRPVRNEWFVKAHTCSSSTVNPLRADFTGFDHPVSRELDTPFRRKWPPCFTGNGHPLVRSSAAAPA